jgi:DNA-binding response OmpR family regulator
LTNSPNTPSTQEPRARVLLVEDDQSLRALWTRAITRLGYDVIVAPDAESAVPLLKDCPDAALCDVHLPGASGLWLADRIRDLSPTTAIVLITADDHIPPSESLRPGIVSYLVKPVTLDQLDGAVHAAVRLSQRQRP